MTTNLTQALRHGAEHALESMAEGWRELRSRAGGALTRFRSGDGGKEDGGETGAHDPPIGAACCLALPRSGEAALRGRDPFRCRLRGGRADGQSSAR